MVENVYKHFVEECGTEDFGYKDILKYLNEHPEVKEINSKYQRDEGLAKSIKEDKIMKFCE